MKGFVLGTIFGAVIILLGFIVGNNLTGNAINSNQNLAVQTQVQENTSNIQIDPKEKANQINEIKKNYIEYSNFRVYNLKNDSQQAYLVSRYQPDELSQDIPVIKLLPPPSISNSELIEYLKDSQLTTIFIVGGDDIDIELAKKLKKETGISIVYEFAKV